MSGRIVSLAQLDPCRYQRAHHADEENIRAIAADLEANGKHLMNPPHVIPKHEGRWEIIAGHDRVEACRRVGMTEVPVRSFAGLVGDDEEVYLHWRRENSLRKTTDRRRDAEETLVAWPTWSNGRIAGACGCSAEYVRRIRAELEEFGDLQPVVSREGSDGRTIETSSIGATKPPRVPQLPSRRAQAIAEQKQQRHVVPISTWQPKQLKRAERALSALPEDEREPIRSLVEEPFVPDVVGADLLERVAAMDPADRAEVVELARSEDERDRSLAKTKAAGRPPMPDPRFTLLNRVELDLKHAIDLCDRDANPSMRDTLEGMRQTAIALRHRLSTRSA